MLKISNLYLKYKNNDFLFQNANATFDSGLWLLDGCNGSGKSTLLHLIDSDNKLNHKDLEVNADAILQIPSKKIFLEQNSIIPNVLESECAEFIFQLNDIVVDDYEPVYRSKKLGSYSTGEQKVAILHIISYLSPELLLLDEYIGNFDDKNLKVIFSYLETMVQRGTIIIVATNENDIKNKFPKRCRIRNRELLISLIGDEENAF